VLYSGWLQAYSITYDNPEKTVYGQTRESKGGKYHRTIDLLFDWFGISCMNTDNFCFYLQNRLIKTCQTGGQLYSDTSLFCIPWTNDLSYLSSTSFTKGKRFITLAPGLLPERRSTPSRMQKRIRRQPSSGELFGATTFSITTLR
jgi:hypothetical protein